VTARRKRNVRRLSDLQTLRKQSRDHRRPVGQAVLTVLLKERVAPRFEAREALLDSAGHAAVEPDGGARQGRKKAAVVADDDEGRAL
jgi:hypothetical protein